MKTPILLLLTVALAFTAFAQEAPSLPPEKQAVWRAINKRWTAWKEVNYEGYREQHHKDWKRWGFNSSRLLTVDDLEMFWQDWQKDEAYVSVELTLTDMKLYGDGYAAVHYMAEARVRWIGKAFTASTGQEVKPGDETTIHTRWSDFLVKEGVRWLYVGGYRDGNCAIWRGYGKPCED